MIPYCAIAHTKEGLAHDNADVMLQVLMGMLYVTHWVSLSGTIITNNKWTLAVNNFL